MYSGYNKFLMFSHVKKAIDETKAIDGERKFSLGELPKEILSIIFSMLPFNQKIKGLVLSRTINTAINETIFRDLATQKLATDQSFWSKKLDKDFSKIMNDDFKSFIFANKKSIAALLNITNRLIKKSSDTETFLSSLITIIQSGYDVLLKRILTVNYSAFVDLVAPWVVESSYVFLKSGSSKLNGTIIETLIKAAKETSNKTSLDYIYEKLIQVGRGQKKHQREIEKLIKNSESIETSQLAAVIKKN